MNFNKKVFLVAAVSIFVLAIIFLNFGLPTAGAAGSLQENGRQLRVIIITSAGDGPGSVVPSSSVQARFVKIVNSGKYDIVRTKTVYREGRMVVAEIYYRDGPSIEPLATSAGQGNCLRVKMITAADGGPGSVVPSDSVQARFTKIVNSGRYSIVTTRTVYRGAKMVVAEIYYQEPNCSPRVEPLGQ